jgi:2-hydroxychromene-2-carboxylate isomerase
LLRPIVYSALLDSHGLVGPVETADKRRYTFYDVARCAERDGLAFVGPPAHPFRSIEALRVACLYQDDPRGLGLARAIADAGWLAGLDLTDPQVLEGVTKNAGFDARGLERRIASHEIRLRLRHNTERAIARGVFGVPTFEYRSQLFWGHDRMTHLAQAVAGGGTSTEPAERMLARPRGVDRKRRP